MAGTTGLEPAASAVTGQRSNQLNYVPAFAVKLLYLKELQNWCSAAIYYRDDLSFSNLKNINMSLTSRAILGVFHSHKTKPIR